MDSILLFVATYAVFFIGFLVWALFFAASLRWLDGKPMAFDLSVLSLMVVVVLLVSTEFVKAPAAWFSYLPRAEAAVLRQAMDKRHGALSIRQFAVEAQKFPVPRNTFQRQYAALPSQTRHKTTYTNSTHKGAADVHG
ncbi:hypothetical protein [Acidithiobacillus ferrooxidans]|uniref:hypothetical protein n=1 Tax=Acidithiobacillus ferrooxidans TaxID=920 RepID=UPI0013D8881F|nr:hypothetical protein [Acidithiobacillus ferrooxidans]